MNKVEADEVSDIPNLEEFIKKFGYIKLNGAESPKLG